MEYWLLSIGITFVMIIVFVALMAVGYVVDKKPIKGSCGGLAQYARSSDSPVVCGSCGKTFSEGCEDSEDELKALMG